MSRPRIATINTESGGYTSVTYSDPCTSVPASVSSNHALCFPVGWDHEHPDDYDWFNKYVVERVTERGGKARDLSTAVVTSYNYANGPSWVKPTGDLVKPKEVTYSEFRGYGKVTTTVGTGAGKQRSIAYYFLGNPDPKQQNEDGYDANGFDGDALTAGLPALSLIGRTGALRDNERLAGQSYSVETYDGDRLLSRTVTLPTRVPVTYARESKVRGWRLEQTTAYGFTFDRAGSGVEALRTRSTTTYNTDAQLFQVFDEGAVADTDDDTCTTLTYAGAGDLGLDADEFARAHMIGLVARTLVREGDCSSDKVLTDTAATYDTHGRVLVTTELDAEHGPSAPRVATQTVVSYDKYGHVTESKDALGRKVTTEYGVNDFGLLEYVRTTTPAPDANSDGLAP